MVYFLRLTKALCSCWVVFTLLSCSSDSGSADKASSNENSSPIANAGKDQLVAVDTLILLNGSGSYDEDDDPLSYRWLLSDIPVNSQATLTDANIFNPTFEADLNGDYVVMLIVNDGESDSISDTVLISVTDNNLPPVANAGPDQSVITGSLVTLDGNESVDANQDPLTFLWTITSKPQDSNVTLTRNDGSTTTFSPDVDGTYVVQLRVSDDTTVSEVDSISIISASNNLSLVDQFDGIQPLLTTINKPDSLPDITKNTGRYRANLTDNLNNITLHYNQDQGRLDAALVSFPFEFIARNIGIGQQDNSQLAPPHSGSPFNFTGVQVHALNLDDANSSHVVVGHRGNTGFTIEGKNTVNGVSRVNDIGANEAPLGRADIRIVGNSDRTLTIYWQTPNLSSTTQEDTWILYGAKGNLDPDGKLPGAAPAYGESVYVGLITYAYWSTGVPFVGTCDSVEIK